MRNTSHPKSTTTALSDLGLTVALLRRSLADAEDQIQKLPKDHPGALYYSGRVDALRMALEALADVEVAQ